MPSDAAMAIQSGAGRRRLTGDLGAVIAEANRAVPELFRCRDAWLAQHRSVNALWAADA